jgi:hypothetical protein
MHSPNVNIPILIRLKSVENSLEIVCAIVYGDVSGSDFTRDPGSNPYPNDRFGV